MQNTHDKQLCTGFQWSDLGMESHEISIDLPGGFVWKTTKANYPVLGNTKCNQEFHNENN